MLSIPTSTRIYLASEPVDIRKGFDALAAWVEASGLDVYSGHLFVFLSRRRTHVKVLTWTRGGFALYYKRLERGRFSLPARRADARTITLDATELLVLLDGIDFQKLPKPQVWTPAPRGLDLGP